MGQKASSDLRAKQQATPPDQHAALRGCFGHGLSLGVDEKSPSGGRTGHAVINAQPEASSLREAPQPSGKPALSCIQPSGPDPVEVQPSALPPPRAAPTFASSACSTSTTSTATLASLASSLPSRNSSFSQGKSSSNSLVSLAPSISSISSSSSLVLLPGGQGHSSNALGACSRPKHQDGSAGRPAGLIKSQAVSTNSSSYASSKDINSAAPAFAPAPSTIVTARAPSPTAVNSPAASGGGGKPGNDGTTASHAGSAARAAAAALPVPGPALVQAAAAKPRAQRRTKTEVSAGRTTPTPPPPPLPTAAPKTARPASAAAGASAGSSAAAARTVNPSDAPTAAAAGGKAGGSSAARTAAPAVNVRLSLTVPLATPVLGLRELQVSVVQLSEVKQAHTTWLTAGWEGVEALPAGSQEPQPQPGKKRRTQRAPKVVGYDTEFIGDQLALVQVCCGNRILLVRVPPLRTQPGGGSGSGGDGSGAKAKAKASRKSTKAAKGAASAGGGGGGGAGRQQFPFACPGGLKMLLCDPSIPKAAAEAWQDALMLFGAFGVKLRNGLDLTVACPPSEEDKKRGRTKLSLFAIFEGFFPQSELRKDSSINHQHWFKSLSEKQIKYAALDAFVSYAAGVAVLQRPSPLPAPVDLTLAAAWEVTLAAQWVHTYQFLEAGQPDRIKHDFQRATFVVHKKRGLVLEVHMSRYKTRLRSSCWVEVRLPDDRRLSGKCFNAHGKTAQVDKLRWVGSGGGRDVKPAEVSTVKSIEMEEVSDTPEEEAIRVLIIGVLTGRKSLAQSPLAAGVFGTAGLAVSRETQPSHAAALSPQLGRLLSSGCVNDSQQRAIEAILLGDRAVQLVQGPPGTGKTTVISHTVDLWVRRVAPRLPPLGAERRREAMACVARSNVAARNIALALLKRGLGPQDFRLVVSHEFHFEWHEEQYRGPLQDVLITSDELTNAAMPRRLEEVKVFVTTVSMLAKGSFRTTALYGKVLTRLLVDEASQIYAGDLALPLEQYGKHLRSLSLFGDDMQLPPYGSEWDGAQIPSMFDHLSPRPASAAATATAAATAAASALPAAGGGAPKPRSPLRAQPNAFSVGPQLLPPAGGCGSGGAHRLLLSVSYRLPRQLCGFISCEMYGSQLLSGKASTAAGEGRSVRWVHIVGKEDNRGGPSTCNEPEAKAICRLVKREFEGRSWTVLTGYDLQRSVLQKLVAQANLSPRNCGGGSGTGSDGSDRVYNVDTFQGREDEVVVASLVRCRDSLGFLRDDRRVNVMLTRCTRQLVVVGNLHLALAHPDTLIGRMAAYCQGLKLVEAAAC